jgi:hypothetical protein
MSEDLDLLCKPLDRQLQLFVLCFLLHKCLLQSHIPKCSLALLLVRLEENSINQLLLSYEDMALAHESPAEASGRNTPEASHGTDAGHLEPILEESEASSLSPESAIQYLVHDDPEWQAFLESLRED